MFAVSIRYNSKGVGEANVQLGLSARFAVLDAVSFGNSLSISLEVICAIPWFLHAASI